MCAFPFIIFLPCALLWPMKGKGQMRWTEGAGEGHFHISCGMGLAPGCNLDKWLLIKGYFLLPLQRTEGGTAVTWFFFSFKNCFVWSLLHDNPQLSNLGKKCVFSYMKLGGRINSFFPSSPPPHREETLAQLLRKFSLWSFKSSILEWQHIEALLSVALIGIKSCEHFFKMVLCAVVLSPVHVLPTRPCQCVRSESRYTDEYNSNTPVWGELWNWFPLWCFFL